MHLVQLLLPLYDNDGEAIAAELFARVAAELTERYGGLTSYARAPAAGLWKDGPGPAKRDDIAVYEVMVERLDPAWWADYRRDLERRFQQEELVIRAQEIRKL